MLLFSTLLDINDKLTKDSFIQLVLDWNQESRHQENVIEGIEWKGERNIRYGTDKLWLDIQEYRNQNIIAIRYEKLQEGGAVWDTDYVMNFNSMKMSIRLDRSFTADALTTERRYSIPTFINMLIDEGYVADDKDLPVTYTPLEIDTDSIKILADIINGEKDYNLPIVYVSKTFYDEDPLDVGKLAARLKGVAHVLVQQNNYTNDTLRKLCNDQNEYYGAVGIYFSKPSIDHKRYLMDKTQLDKTIQEVISHQNAQHIDNLYTWQGVNNALLKDRLTAQKEERVKAEDERRKILDKLLEFTKNRDQEKESIYQEAKDEANKLLEEFDDEQRKDQEEIERLSKLNDRLEAENFGLNAKLDEIDNDEIPILHKGQEMEFYPGEIRDLVLETLSEIQFDEKQHTRRGDVVKDIIANNDYQENGKENSAELKNLLKTYNGMTSQLRQALEKMGFEITEEGKHYKLKYYQDDRYIITLSKTPSDGRSGKNDYTLINKIAF